MIATKFSNKVTGYKRQCLLLVSSRELCRLISVKSGLQPTHCVLQSLQCWWFLLFPYHSPLRRNGNMLRASKCSTGDENYQYCVAITCHTVNYFDRWPTRNLLPNIRNFSPFVFPSDRSMLRFSVEYECELWADVIVWYAAIFQYR